ncbi:ATP-binding protein [Nocardioides sp. AN3]
MPLSRPALTLAPGPKGVQEARQWVVTTCRDIGRHDLVECAEVGVAELVANAILHGADPISVRVRGTVGHPRIEVRDASVERPVLPSAQPLAADDDLLLTFGRGLTIVARSSTAWGAEIEADGKVVWFEPAAEFADDGVKGVISDLAPRRDESEAPDLFDVALRGVPLELYVGFQAHFRELRREVRLLALAHAADYPLADDLSELFAALETELHTGIGLTEFLEPPSDGGDATGGPQGGGTGTADLTVRMPRSAAPTLRRFLGLLDLADEFCRQERLLALARTEEQRAFQTWFLGEYVRQAEGRAPLSWPGLPQQLQAVAR